MTEPGNSHVKQTPGRRRPGQNAARSAARKNYASENDAAGANTNFRPDFVAPRNHNQGGGGGPSTPQKTQRTGAQSKSPAPSSMPASGKTNKRSGNKNHPKNISTSPAPAKPGRQTPPQTAGAKLTGASAPAAAAFAGATFHASPAPSSLPLPSFFTKTNSPDAPGEKLVDGLSHKASPPASDSELPSATATEMQKAPAGRAPPFSSSTLAAPPRRDESPLDIFFKADRAEKERSRRASSANIFGAPVGPFSPPIQTQAVSDNANSNTFPRDISQQHQQQSMRRPAPTLRTSSSGISAAELDGTPGQPIGPAFATPFQDRIRAARPNEGRGLTASTLGGPAGFRDLSTGPGSAPLPSGQREPAAAVDDRSEALKRYLFSKTATPPASGSPTAPDPATPTRHPGPNTGPWPAGSAGSGASPFQNIYSTPPASAEPNHPYYRGQSSHSPNNPAGSTGSTGSNNGNGTPNISAMESSLRQILKLDSPYSTGAMSSNGPRRS